MEVRTSGSARAAAALTACLAVLAGGCATMAPGVPSQSGYRLTEQEAVLLQGRLHGAERPRLSLAMSGGGLRSSLFNFGVLKALYDHGVLDDVDLVSSVSGGSYLAYYLYSMQALAPAQPFGSTVFDDAAFAQRTCELVANANFVTYGNMALAAAKWPVRGNDAFTWMYEEQLQATFGRKGPAFAELQPLVMAGHTPYLVVNATTYGRQEDPVPWNARLFEFTPLAHGNFERGYAAWPASEPPVAEHTLLHATAASGAAQGALRRSFAAPFAGSSPDDTIELWDGGKAENLGAAAPLLRGTQGLIIVDAQYDNRGDAMEAYHTLQRRMEDLGVGVSLDMQPRFRADGVYPGRASGQGLASQLYYVKMDIPPSFRERVYSAAGEAELLAAKDADDTYWRTLGQPVGGEWQCGNLASFRTDYRQWLFLQAATYLRYAERKGLWARVERADPHGVGTWINHSFPRTTTVDQSFYIDQALAFIGLGYSIADGKVRTLMEEDGAATSSRAGSASD